jgi:hypothetical protein
VSLRTPDAIRSLQRKLYTAAKAEPARRFHQLYGKVYRSDILLHAYFLARAAKGARARGGWGEVRRHRGTLSGRRDVVKLLRSMMRSQLRCNRGPLTPRYRLTSTARMPRSTTAGLANARRAALTPRIGRYYRLQHSPRPVAQVLAEGVLLIPREVSDHLLQVQAQIVRPLVDGKMLGLCHSPTEKKTFAEG